MKYPPLNKVTKKNAQTRNTNSSSNQRNVAATLRANAFLVVITNFLVYIADKMQSLKIAFHIEVSEIELKSNNYRWKLKTSANVGKSEISHSTTILEHSVTILFCLCENYLPLHYPDQNQCLN